MNERQLTDVARLMRKGAGADWCDADGLIQHLEADARALWAVRVLDAYAHKTGHAVFTRHSLGLGWRTESVRLRLAGEDFHPTPDAARVAAAEALVAEDPSLGEGL